MRKIGEITIRKTDDKRRIEKYIEEVLDYYNVPAEYFGNILLAVNEAIELLLRKQNKTENLILNVRKTKQGISFQIQSKKAPDIHLLDEIDKAIARNELIRETFLITTLTDGIELTNHGRKLRLNFVISGLSYQRSLERTEKLKNYFCTKERVFDQNE